LHKGGVLRLSLQHLTLQLTLQRTLAVASVAAGRVAKLRGHN
jgi:hypothetical protein